jgi:sulfide:quinone oxidoreductase
MTEPKQLADDISVCAFVPPDRLAELAPRFRTIINNRPDMEEPGQPDSAEIEAEARRLGLDYVHLPVVPGQFADDQAAKFGKAVAASRGPVLAFCKSGRRAATLWALAQKGKQPVDDILAAASAAGFDLSSLRDTLTESADSPG